MKEKERNYSCWWVWASDVTANISRATTLCQFLGQKMLLRPLTVLRAKQDAGPKSQETGQGETKLKQSVRQNYMQGQGTKRLTAKISCGEDFLEKSFELHVETQVAFFNVRLMLWDGGKTECIPCRRGLNEEQWGELFGEWHLWRPVLFTWPLSCLQYEYLEFSGQFVNL